MDYFVYDNIDTRNYTGIYVVFNNVDNTPKRVYDEVEIPARNGKYYIDKERFEDVEQIYYVIAMTKANGSALINALASKIGYNKLTDSFNTDEYYEAVFTSGAEVNITSDRDVNKFKITFTRKPQRFLTSGETESTVANNGTLTNPTLFESKPVLKVQGYGDIGINDDTITLESIPVGNVFLANSKNFYIEYPRSTSPLSTNYIGSQFIDSTKLKTGDTFTLDPSTWTYTIKLTSQGYTFSSATIDAETGTEASTKSLIQDEKTALWVTTFEPIEFVLGTPKSVSHSYRLECEYTNGSISAPSTITFEYDGTNEISLSATRRSHLGVYTIYGDGTIGETNGYSTIQISGTITIDLDLGDAFWNNSGTIMDANNAISLGAKIPTLKTGTNTFTYPNTITSFKVKPNWWKV